MCGHNETLLPSNLADVLIHLHIPKMLRAGILFGTCGCSELAGGLGVNSSKSEQIRRQAGADCDLKWERAYTWVVESSGLKLKTKTDAIIKTVEPLGESRTLVVTITKNTTSQAGTYEIDFIGECSSIFSCVPSVAETRTRFANFVLAAELVLTRHYLTASPYQAIAALWLSSFAADSPAGVCKSVLSGAGRDRLVRLTSACVLS
jgi:hypothetical protein